MEIEYDANLDDNIEFNIYATSHNTQARRRLLIQTH